MARLNFKKYFSSSLAVSQQHVKTKETAVKPLNLVDQRLYFRVY